MWLFRLKFLCILAILIPAGASAHTSCSEAWSTAKQTDYFYDFQKDPTSESLNISKFNDSGYKNYLQRMLEQKLTGPPVQKPGPS